MSKIRTTLIREVLRKMIVLANEDIVIQQELKAAEGENILFVITDLKAPYGFVIHRDHFEFVDKPTPSPDYGLIATCDENTFIHLLRGLDVDDAFWSGALDVTGKRWFKRLMVIRRLFQLGEKRGIKRKLVQKAD